MRHTLTFLPRLARYRERALVMVLLLCVLLAGLLFAAAAVVEAYGSRSMDPTGSETVWVTQCGGCLPAAAWLAYHVAGMPVPDDTATLLAKAEAERVIQLAHRLRELMATIAALPLFVGTAAVLADSRPRGLAAGSNAPAASASSNGTV